MTTEPSNQLERAANRAARDPFFLGHLLDPLVESGCTTRRGLAARLKCHESQLARLWLCRVPKGTAPAFREDVERIASYVACDPARLAMIIREASAIKALGDAGSDRSQLTLLAARDRLDNACPKPEDGDDQQ